jgi:hypothetical protein
MVAMTQVKALTDWMAERGLDLTELVARSGLSRRVVEAVACGRYTPSPDERQRLSAAIGVGSEEVAWGHRNQVTQLYGHGPQFGRSP